MLAVIPCLALSAWKVSKSTVFANILSSQYCWHVRKVICKPMYTQEFHWSVWRVRRCILVGGNKHRQFKMGMSPGDRKDMDGDRKNRRVPERKLTHLGCRSGNVPKPPGASGGTRHPRDHQWQSSEAALASDSQLETQSVTRDGNYEKLSWGRLYQPWHTKCWFFPVWAKTFTGFI